MARKRKRRARAPRAVKSRLLAAVIALAYGDQYAGREQLERAAQQQLIKRMQAIRPPPPLPGWWSDQRKASTGTLQRRARPIRAPELFPFI